MHRFRHARLKLTPEHISQQQRESHEIENMNRMLLYYPDNLGELLLGLQSFCAWCWCSSLVELLIWGAAARLVGTTRAISALQHPS